MATSPGFGSMPDTEAQCRHRAKLSAHLARLKEGFEPRDLTIPREAGAWAEGTVKCHRVEDVKDYCFDWYQTAAWVPCENVAASGSLGCGTLVEYISLWPLAFLPTCSVQLSPDPR